MKNIFKNIILFWVSITMLIFPAGVALADPAGDIEKEEVVYANLDAAGVVKEIYVVNILDVKQSGTVTDYGKYSSVKNLTNTQSLLLADGKITADLPTGNFYYQGTLDDADLPWTIAISYYLDGKRLSPAELAGTDGNLQIAVTTAANTKVDSSFYENYLLQISVSLDTNKCENITAAGATLANAGKYKMINYTVMPGEDASISINAQVTDFEMPGMDITAIPFSMQIDTPDTSALTDDMTLLSDAVSDLYDGIGDLKYGVKKMKDGTADIKSGSSGFLSGLNDLNSGSASLVAGSSQIKDGLSAILLSLSGSSGSFSLGSLTTLPAALSSLASGLDGVSGGLTDLKNAFVPAYAALDAAMSVIPDYTITSTDIDAIKADSPANSTTIDQLYETYTAAAAAKTTYNSVKPAFDSVGSSIDTMVGSLNTISGTLSTMSTEISTALASGGIDTAIASLTAGLTELSTNYSTFHQGLVDYTGGVSELASGYSSLNTGIAGIADGISDLYSGVRDLYSGTGELNTAVADMPGQVELKIDEWMGEYDKSDYEPVSFVSPNNTTEAVQFVLKTEKIEKPEEPAPTVEEEKDTFWTRLVNLFK